MFSKQDYFKNSYKVFVTLMQLYYVSDEVNYKEKLFQDFSYSLNIVF